MAPTTRNRDWIEVRAKRTEAKRPQSSPVKVTPAKYYEATTRASGIQGERISAYFAVITSYLLPMFVHLATEHGGIQSIPQTLSPVARSSLGMIPFNRPSIVGNELKYISEAVANGHISGDGPFTRKCQEFLETELGVKKALLTTSCTHSLEMAAMLLRMGPGYEVIVPSFTFVSTVNAFVLHGAKPVFIDIRPDTLNMDEAQLERLITPRTKAIVAVHYAGVGCEMETILETAQRHNVAIVEDNAHGLFGKYKDEYLGTFGCLAAQSFHETKNLTCGEGGALLINDKKYVERADILREKGTNRSRFFLGQVDKYTWIDIGSSYAPSDILAAFLYAQLEAHERIQNTRRRIWKYYYSHLQEWARNNDVRLPIMPAHCEQSYHMFYLLMPSLKERNALIEHLMARDILGVFHYLPLHLSAMGRRFGGKEGDCPVTETVTDRIVRLPFYNNLNEADQAYVTNAIKEFNLKSGSR